MDNSRSRRFLVALLATALVLVSVPSSALAANAVFQGKVVTEDGVTPVEGVVIRIGTEESGLIYDSAPTTADGAFRLDAAPAGSYAVLAQRGEVGYIAGANLELAPGENPPVAIVIRSAGQIAPAQTTPSKLPGWGKAVIGGTIMILTWAVFEDTSEEGLDSETPF